MMAPSAAFHVTLLFVTVPATTAEKVVLPPACSDIAAGDTVTEVTLGGGGGGAVTVTLDVSDLVGSATLVAVTVSVPAFAGAVY